MLEWAKDLQDRTDVVLDGVIQSLDPLTASGRFSAAGTDLLARVDAYQEDARVIRQEFIRAIADQSITAVAAFFFSEVLAAHDRVIRHAADIARLEVEPGFDLPPGATV
jgi:hypothetical protein